jgi:fluoroacetyl-CoA thioesterase
LPLGLEGAIAREVAFEWTIAAYDSRLPAVLSTPAMIGLMEVAAAQAIAPHLPPGAISVGTRIEVDHLKAVPPGMMVEARAKLSGTSGRFLIFEAEARAGEVTIGRGRVFRAIVPLAQFSEKASRRD